MSIVVTAGQRGDSPQFEVLLGRIRVPRLGPGRPRARPDRVRADKAYTSRKNRAYLRRRGIRRTIPDKADQARNRKKRSSRGGRPPKFDLADHKARHAVVRHQSPQKAPRRGHEVRQARGPLRGDRPLRGHQ
ncbi:transposase [Streptomyces pseudovenezuelae]|uniref:transposase n=1 Tax=Streptomyces pseudovenezuelae TaxID=67350 RepID=UPI002E34764D|nr:transposase [Streptomyces pseudovenezuelae]